MARYTGPANFDATIADISARAEHDSAFADALRCMTVYSADYCRGVLATIGLDRLGADYCSAQLVVRKLGEEIPNAVTEDDPFGLADPSPEIQVARDRLAGERARLREIEGLVTRIAQCGETLNYDGAPA
ncbi:MAG: hypothetical protein AB7G13_28790 [Lautropia sp.]